MEITALKLKDRKFDNWYSEVDDRWDYADFLKDETWRKDWISFDCLCYEPITDTIFAGITSFDADIFWGWNRKDKKWFNPGYARIGNRYDAKFHRSLVRHSNDGCLYATQALLHDVDRFWEAPGASIVKYAPATNEIAKLAIPMPHVYIQAIVLDEDRDMIYGQTFTPENLVSYNLKTGESKCLGPISSGMSMAQGENICLDDDGCVWGVWGLMRAWRPTPGADEFRIFKYAPEIDSIEYMDKGLPKKDGSYGYEKPEGFFNFGTGVLYVSGGGGALYRLDPKTGDAKFLFQAVKDEGRERRSRLASMRMGTDGFAYGVTGRDGECEIIRFDPKDESFQLLGTLKDSETGEAAWQIHDICITPDGVLYAAENDNIYRSSYLWEIKL